MQMYMQANRQVARAASDKQMRSVKLGGRVMLLHHLSLEILPQHSGKQVWMRQVACSALHHYLPAGLARAQVRACPCAVCVHLCDSADVIMYICIVSIPA